MSADNIIIIVVIIIITTIILIIIKIHDAVLLKCHCFFILKYNKKKRKLADFYKHSNPDTVIISLFVFF